MKMCACIRGKHSEVGRDSEMKCQECLIWGGGGEKIILFERRFRVGICFMFCHIFSLTFEMF